MPAQMTKYPKPGSVAFKPADQKSIAPTVATDIALDSEEEKNVTLVVTAGHNVI